MNSNTAVIGMLKANKKGWQANKLKLKTSDEFKKVKLKEKNDTITFIGKPPFAPRIDYIKIVSGENDEGFDMEAYNKRIKEQEREDSTRKVNMNKLKSEPMPSAPENYYDYSDNVQVEYTYWEQIYIGYGQSVTVETTGASATNQPILHVFLRGYNYEKIAVGMFFCNKPFCFRWRHN